MSAEHGITCDCGETFTTVAGLQTHSDEPIANLQEVKRRREAWIAETKGGTSEQ